jgi:hypothetical protein
VDKTAVRAFLDWLSRERYFIGEMPSSHRLDDHEGWGHAVHPLVESFLGADGVQYEAITCALCSPTCRFCAKTLGEIKHPHGIPRHSRCPHCRKHQDPVEEAKEAQARAARLEANAARHARNRTRSKRDPDYEHNSDSF